MKNSKKINIVIPMAGAGSRFTNAGFVVPKPFLNINGKPMIQVVYENLRPKKYDYNFIFICQQQMLKEFNYIYELAKNDEKIKVIEINKMTDGQLSTVLLAEDYINNDEYLLVANCDQYININMDDFYDFAIQNNLDGLIMTMPSDGNPKWSYSKVNSDGYVVETAEKKVISNEATTGVYFFKKGSFIVDSAKVIKNVGARVNGEYYVCPCYNPMIANGLVKIMNYNVFENMWGLGTPEDLCKFLVSDLSRKI